MCMRKSQKGSKERLSRRARMCENAKKTKKVKTENRGRKPICMRKSHGLKKGRNIDEESKPYFLRSNCIKSMRARVCEKVT